jgi:hypothetical protein
MCDTVTQIGSDTTRRERLTLVQAIQREHELLEPTTPAQDVYSAATLRMATAKELRLIAKRFGIEADTRTTKGTIVEVLTRQAQLRAIRHDARAVKVEQALERITHLAERLRAILPEGMTLGSYLQVPKPKRPKRYAYRY